MNEARNGSHAAVPRVVASGGEWPAGLALLRGLRDGGYAPVAAVSELGSPIRFSRAPDYRVRVPDALRAPAAHAAGLGRAATDAGAPAVLPGTDASLLALAEHRAAVPDPIAVGVPSLEVVRVALDKAALRPLARQAGLRTPETALLERAEDYRGSFPAIVKPGSSVVRDARGRRRRLTVTVVEDRRELARALGRCRGACLVQPYVDAGLRTVSGVAWEGRLVTAVHKRSERTWPRDAGIFACGSTVGADADLEDRCGRFLAAVGWSGIFNLQFLDDEDAPLLIDFNPRAYHSLALATAAGTNLAATWCDLVLGREPRPGAARPGVRFRSEEEEIRGLREAVREGSVRSVAAFRPAPRTVHALFHPRDPAPVVALAGSFNRLAAKWPRKERG